MLCYQMLLPGYLLGNISVILKISLPDVAFLNRMTITLAILLSITIGMSLLSKSEASQSEGKAPEKEKSSIIFNVGALIILVSIGAFYLVFW